MTKKTWTSRIAIGSTLVLLAATGLTGCQTPETEQAHLARLDRMMEQQNHIISLIDRLTMEPSTSAPVAAAPTAPAAPATAPSVTKIAAPAAATVSTVKNSQLTGRLSSIGSDTMDNLMKYWQDGFREQFPNVTIYHQGRGSSTAIPALAEGKANIGPMSRTLKTSEIEYFKKKFGYAPVQLRVALDCVAVYVNPDNPLAKQGLTFQQLDSIFSKACLRGGKKALTWGDLGLTGSWADAPIHVYGRNNASGTHAFFKETVLTKSGEYTDRCKEMRGSEALVEAIAKDRLGIGYSGIGYKNSSVAVLPLSVDNPNNVYPPELQHAYTGEYPLTRFLHLAVNKNPAKDMDELTTDFIDYVLSDDGQKIVLKDGFYTLSSKIIQEEKAKLGL